MKLLPATFYCLKAGLLAKPVTSAHPELTPLTDIRYLCRNKINCPLPETILYCPQGKPALMQSDIFFFLGI